MVVHTVPLARSFWCFSLQWRLSKYRVAAWCTPSTVGEVQLVIHCWWECVVKMWLLSQSLSSSSWTLSLGMVQQNPRPVEDTEILLIMRACTSTLSVDPREVAMYRFVDAFRSLRSRFWIVICRVTFWREAFVVHGRLFQPHISGINNAPTDINYAEDSGFM